MKKKAKWFKAGKKALKWRKGLTPTGRRRLALKARGGDPLKAGRALQALSNVTKDKETKVKAGADAKYFFSKVKKMGKGYASSSKKAGRKIRKIKRRK